MLLIDYSKQNTARLILCLGQFDGLHLGHERLILEAKRQKAEDNSLLVGLFTFKDGFTDFFKNGKNLLTFQEKIELAEKLGIEVVVAADCAPSLFSLSPDEFLNSLTDRLSVASLICGSDYTFGANSQGKAQTVAEFCANKNIDFCKVNDFFIDGEKVSSTRIKRLLQNGEVKAASKLLGYEFFIKGEVEKGRGTGKTLGFPTINVTYPKLKVSLKQGVYKGKVKIDEKIYPAIINFGSAPTFAIEKVKVEAFILGFNGNAYGKIAAFYFTDFIREVKKFEDKDQLITQLNEDLKKL